MQLEVLLKTKDYIFVNKPSGMLSIPDRQDPSLENVKRILEKENENIFVVHRIDKDTSGCLMMALNADAHRCASMQFEHRKVSKQYLGIVLGTPHQPKGICEDKLMEHPTLPGKMIVNAKNGKEAITSYEAIEQFAGYTLMRFTIHTGRMHQIRVHSANLGCPIVCDPIYGQATGIYVSRLNKKYKLGKWTEEEQPILNRLALHAHTLSVKDPSGNLIQVEAPLFKDMQATLKQMRKWVGIY